MISLRGILILEDKQDININLNYGGEATWAWLNY